MAKAERNHNTEAQTRGVHTITMTPEYAARLLMNNPANRHISKNAVAAMARDMMAGKWRMNGDAIRVGADGTLFDGQHRLTACVQANVPFETLIVTGLSPEDRLTIDRGRPRTIGDALTMVQGVAGGKNVAATIRNLVIFAKQDLGASPTASEYVEILELHPGILDSVALATGAGPARPALLAAIHYVGSKVQGQRALADAFVQVFKTGIPDYDGDAAHALREMFIKERAKGIRRADFKTYALMASAWDKFVNRTSVRTARAKDDFKLKGWDEDGLYIREKNG
jgi:hypothetical protein